MLFFSIVYITLAALCGLVLWAAGIANSNVSTYAYCFFLGFFWPVWLALLVFTCVFGPAFDKRAHEEEQRIYREDIKRWEKEKDKSS